MSAEAALRDAILSSVHVRGLVGDRVGRVSPTGLGQKPKLPQIGFQRFGTIRSDVLEGASGLAEALFLVDCWDATGDGARALFDAMRIAINGKSFQVADEVVQKISIRNDRDLPEPDVNLFRVQAEVRLWHTEARAA